jgi:hypothetical protein
MSTDDEYDGPWCEKHNHWAEGDPLKCFECILEEIEEGENEAT